MSSIFNENFDGGTAGAAITTPGNTSFNGSSGTAPATFVSSPTRGGLAAKIAVNATFNRFNAPLGTSGVGIPACYARSYYQFSSIAAAINLMNYNLSGVNKGRCRINADGTFSILNNNTAVATSITALAANTWVRLGWKVDSTNGVQALRIFVGANIDGVTADEEISGVYSQGAVDAFGCGVTTSPGLGIVVDVFMDYVALDNAAYPGPPALALQIGRPATDVTTTNWTGSAASNPLALLIGESVEDDTTYIQSAVNPANALLETKLNSITDPGAGNRTGYTIAYTLSAPGSTSASVVTSLMQGATVIASWTDAVPTAITPFSKVMTDAQCAAITDYANLSIRHVATAS